MSSMKHAILGFLSWQSMSGYDLKKLFAQSDVQYWSGNNNQIYRALVDLHKAGLVSKEVQHHDDSPSRKVYTITEQGQAALREWVASPPALPDLRNGFHIQLLWADVLDPDELDQLLGQYEEELMVKVRMLREQDRRGRAGPRRTAREAFLWTTITGGQIGFYEGELAWLRRLRQGLAEL